MKLRKIKTKKMTREMPIDSGSIDIDNRTVDVSFSSEVEVKRWFGIEILDHANGSINLSRLKDGAAVCDEHCRQVGVVEKVEIRDKRGYARLRFSKSAYADEIFQDIVDGIRRNISVRYSIEKIREERDEETKISTYRVMKWTPSEISVVGVPADHTVGVGRSASMDEEYDTEILELERTEQKPKPTETRKMEDDEDETDTDNKVNVEVIKNEASERALKAERSRVKEIGAIAEKHPKVAELARNAIDSGMPLDEFSRKAFEAIASNSAKPVEAKPLQLDGKEDKRYSILNVMRAIAENKRDIAGFEFEVSDQIAKNMRKDTPGIFIPHNLNTFVPSSGSRTMSKGTATAGGNLVDTELKTESFISLLRKKLVLRQAGARIITDLVGDIAIPKQTGGASVYWVAEDGSVSESTPSIGQVTLSPKTMGTYTEVTRNLLLQSSMDMEAFVRMDLATAAAHGFEAAGLAGTGASNQPTGLHYLSGTNSIALGTDGAALTWADVVNFESLVAADDADVDGMCYITNAKVRGKLKTTLKASGVAGYIWESDNTLNGYTGRVTNHVPSDLTKGEGTDLSAMYFGNFNDVIIGMWGAMELLVNPYTEQKNGKIIISMLQSMDVAFRHAESFTVCKDIVTT